MANIIDATAPVSITLIAQGFADIQSLTASPNPAGVGVTVTVSPTIRNNTGSTDMLWMRKYVNNVESGSAWSASVTGGSTVVPLWTFVMPGSNALVRVDAGHMVGSTQVMDDSMQTTVTLAAALPEAIFVGTPTYTPGQVVEPGTTVTIGYQVQNTGGSGMLWGGLYDYQSPTPNLIGGYWEQTVAPGSPISKTVSIVVNQAFDGQLLCGHFE